MYIVYISLLIFMLDLHILIQFVSVCAIAVSLKPFNVKDPSMDPKTFTYYYCF